MVVRYDDKIKYIGNDDSFGDLADNDDEDDPRLLVYLKRTGEQEFAVEPRDDCQSLHNRIWLVIRSLKTTQYTEDYQLRTNDVIKLGRIILRVTEVNSEYESPDSVQDGQFDDVITLENEPANEDTCRF